MKKTSPSLLLLCLLSLLLFSPLLGRAADQATSASIASTALKYKLISGFKQPFTDDLQLHLSKGWIPVGGVSVTVWNNDLYFAQLISKPASR